MTATTERSGLVRRLVFFFGLAYFAQGIAQTTMLIDQPLTHYMTHALGLNEVQVTARLAVLILPWTIKPLYGLISDFLPLAGYRRKTYLLLTSLLATLGFLWITGQMTGPASLTWVLTTLLLTSFGVAFSDVLVDAVMVEKGNALGETRRFQATQWLWISVAGIVSGLAGGFLTQHFSAKSAVAVAAGMASLAPMAVGVLGWLMVPDTRAQANRKTGRSLMEALRSRQLWMVIGFLVLWNFSPGFGIPLYTHLKQRMLFSDEFIGVLRSVRSGGAVLGALLFPLLTARLTSRRILSLAILLSVVSTLAYLLIGNQTSGIVVYLASGVMNMFVSLALFDLAARSCPNDAEGFSFAALMSVLNLTGQGADVLGAQLYVGVFDRHLTPLILVSALTTLCVYPLLSRLPQQSAQCPEK
jgi:Na+/melibiose symporter-like transporter